MPKAIWCSTDNAPLNSSKVGYAYFKVDEKTSMQFRYSREKT